MNPNHSIPGTANGREQTRGISRFPFRWRSRLGVAVALFLAIGGLNFAAAVAVPITLHLGGPAATGGLVLGNDADGAFLGRSLSDVNSADPAMGTFLVTFMDTMCAFMMSFALIELGVTWFALRGAQRWALWTNLIGTVAIVPYYLVIGWTFALRGVPVSMVFIGVIGGALIVAILAVLAAGLGWVGIREVRVATPQ